MSNDKRLMGHCSSSSSSATASAMEMATLYASKPTTLDEDADSLVHIVGTIGLGGEPAGAHAEEPEVPIDEVEYLGSDGNSSQVVGTEMPDDGHINHAQKGHGDVGDDVG